MQESFGFTDSGKRAEETITEVSSQAQVASSSQPDTTTIKEQEAAVSHFWAGVGSQYSSVLVIVPNKDDLQNQHQLKVYDADGELVNELELQFASGQIGVFDLDAACGDCKVVSGICQAHVEIQSYPGTQHHCFIDTESQDLSVGPAQDLNREEVAFFPLRLSSKSKNVLAFFNAFQPNASVRCRLYTGTRSPEIDLKIPAYGALTQQIETAFAEYLELSDADVQAYLRITTHSSAELKVQLLEKKYQRSNVNDSYSE